MTPETKRLARALIKASFNVQNARIRPFPSSNLRPVLSGYQQGLARAIGVICDELGERCTDEEIDQLEDEVRREQVGEIPNIIGGFDMTAIKKALGQ